MAKLAAKSKKVLVGAEYVTVSICLTEDEGLDINDGGKWLLMCEAHKFILQDTSYRRLWRWADAVEEFCDECRANDRVTLSA